MTLATGHTLSFYEILGPLGAGGMGEVYRARDTRLDRDVALKVLPEELAGDEERLRRFDREAKTLASLNHPNVAGIHGVDQDGDVCFLALELVPGEDLSKRIARGALSVDETVDVCRQIAEGLAAAHEAGVVHRDLKPANVRITPEGVVKVLDFGLAKPIGTRGAGPDSKTPQSDSFQLTEAGLMLGTPTYMSPEQVKGRPVDRRTDVWAFGCVLFECLAGVRAFDAETVPELLASVLDHEPAWEKLPARLPPHLRLLLERTLTKDPRQRLHDLSDARLELESGAERFAALSAAASTRSTVGAGRASAWKLPVAAGVTLAIGLAIGRMFVPAYEAAAREGYLFTAVTDLAGVEAFPSLSPDGKTVVYAAEIGNEWDIYAQRVGGTRAQNLTDEIEGDHTHPKLSPDGERIAFRSEHDGGGIFVMGATGESPRRVTDFGFNPAWSPDGTRLAFATEEADDPTSRSGLSRLMTVDVASGETRHVEVFDAMQPAWSPNGLWIAYWAYDHGGQRDLYTVSADGSREPTRLTDDPPTDWSPAWSPDGLELWFSSNRAGVMNLWRMKMDPETGAAVGSPQPVINGVGASCRHVSFTADGERVAFSAQTTDGYIIRVPFDLERREVIGTPERVPGSRGANMMSVSPDREWLAFHAAGAGHEDIFVMRVDGSERRRITDDVHKTRGPVWSPDGSRIYFYSDRSGSYQIWSCAPDGSDQVRHTDLEHCILASLSPDGKRMVGSGRKREIFFLDPHARAEDQTPTRAALFPEPDTFVLPQAWSPDGRWISVSIIGDDGESLALLSADGTQYERVAEDTFGGSWLPDSSGILTTTSSGDYQLLDMESGETRVILDLPSVRIGIGRVSPDGRWLYLAVSTVGADVWVADHVATESGS